MHILHICLFLPICIVVYLNQLIKDVNIKVVPTIVFSKYYLVNNIYHLCI